MATDTPLQEVSPHLGVLQLPALRQFSAVPVLQPEDLEELRSRPLPLPVLAVLVATLALLPRVALGVPSLNLLLHLVLLLPLRLRVRLGVHGLPARAHPLLAVYLLLAEPRERFLALLALPPVRLLPRRSLAP